MPEEKSPWKIMTEENEVQGRELCEIVREIRENHPYGLPPLIRAKPEEPPDYDPNMSKEAIYRELARLNFRNVVVPFTTIQPEYLRSLIPRYDALIPLIEDEGIKQYTRNFRDFTKTKLEKIEEVRVSLQERAKEIRSHYSTPHS